MYLGNPLRHRPLVDVRVELHGADNAERPGVLVAQALTGVDGGFFLTPLLNEEGEYPYYSLVLTQPQDEVTAVEPGRGGEERALTWVGFPPPHLQASLDTVWYVRYPPLRVDVDPNEPIPAIKGNPTFEIIQPIDFKVDGVELTQAIQCFDSSEGDPNCPDNSLPLVAGKLTAARVYISRVGAPSPEPQYPAVRVDLFVAGAVPGSPVPVVNTASQLYKVPLKWDRWKTATTANFLIAAPLPGTLYAWAQVNADNRWPDPDPTNNTAAAAVVAVTTTRPAKIKWLRVNYDPDPSTRFPSFPFTGPNLADESWVVQRSLDVARVVFPTAIIDYQKFVPGILDYFIEVPADSTFKTFKKIKPDIRDDFVVNGKTHWAMSSFLNNRLVVEVPAQRDYDTLLAWFPPGSTAGGDVPDGVAEGAPPIVSIGSGRACLGAAPMAKIGAHEVAHNFGLGHFPCFLNPDLWHPWPAPYDDCSPVETPFDPFLMQVENSMTFMTYGGDSISPVEWKFLLGKLQKPVGAGAQLAESEVPAMLVRGWLDDDGSGGFYPLFTVTAAPGVPNGAPAAAAEVRLLDSSGQTLAGYPFDLRFDVPDEPPSDVAPFQWWLPRPTGLDRVQLLRSGVVVHERRASAHAPQGAWVSPAAGASLEGTAALTWQASDADGDPLFFTVSFSHDGGETWTPLAVDRTDPEYELDAGELPGGEQCLVRVLASDGFDTHEILGGPFRIGRKPPEVAISSPRDDEEVNEAETRVFTAWAVDPEDGSLSGDALQWSSDRDGPLGSGATLIVPGLALSPGEQVITLTATDSDGMETRATVRVGVTRTVSCVGDCAQDGAVTIDDLVTMVIVALGGAPVFDCEAGDADGDGQITVNELIAAVNASLAGCEP